MSTRAGGVCWIGDRSFVVNVEDVSWATVRPTRQGVDQSAGAGEASLSNEVVWRRVRNNWVGGAGQEFADLTDQEDPSSVVRFHQSTNADPWTRRALTVGRPRVFMRSRTGQDFLRPYPLTYGQGGGFWIVDGNQVAAHWADSRSGETGQILATPVSLGGAPVGATTFGDDQLYVVLDDGTIRVLTFDGTDAATNVAFGSVQVDMIAAASTRLIAANGPALFELGATGDRLDIYEHDNANFRWRGALAANNGIYVWGDVGGTGQIFRLPISDATGAVDPPIPAGTLPVGEVVTEMLAFVGTVMIGTNLGGRLATSEADGSLIFGPVVAELGGVRSMAPAGRFVYVVTNKAPHVWRVDPSRFSEALVPAYAAESSHLVGEGTVHASSVATSVVGSGEDDDPAAVVVAVACGHRVSFYSDELDGVPLVAPQATVDLGWFSFGIGEDLSLDSVTVEVEPTPDGAQHQLHVFVDVPEREGVVQGATDFTDGEIRLTLHAPDDIRARRFRVRLALHADTELGSAPVVREVVLRAAPAPHLSDEMILPLILSSGVRSEHGLEGGLDVWREWSYLRELRNSRERVRLQLGAFEATVRVEDIGVRSGGLGGDNGLDGWDVNSNWMKGMWDVRLVTVSEAS